MRTKIETRGDEYQTRGPVPARQPYLYDYEELENEYNLERGVYIYIHTGIMPTEIKDTLTVIGANGGALGISLTQCNEILQLVSMLLAIGYTLYRIYKLKNV